METLPIKIFNALRYGYTPTMASVTILFVATAAVIFWLIARFGESAEAARRHVVGDIRYESPLCRCARRRVIRKPTWLASNGP